MDSGLTFPSDFPYPCREFWFQVSPFGVVVVIFIRRPAQLGGKV